MKALLKKKLQNLKEKKGFTLVEMIVVLAIIGILVGLIAPNVATLIKDANETSNAAKAKNVLTTAQAYATKHIKDDYGYYGGVSVGGGGGAGASGPSETVVYAATGSALDTGMKALWKSNFDTPPVATTVAYCGAGDAYIPENIVGGVNHVAVYFSNTGTPTGAVYVVDAKVAAVVGTGGVASGITGAKDWTYGKLKGAAVATDGKITLPTPPTTP